MQQTKTTNVRFRSQSVPAYAERVAQTDGSPARIVVRVYDHVAGHFVIPVSLTPAQQRHVIARTLPKSA